MSTHLANSLINLIQNFEKYVFPKQIKEWILKQKLQSSLPLKMVY